MGAARLEVVSRDACDEARALASAALDGHLLDEVNRRILGRHLQACADCTRFVRRIESIALLLRSAPLEPFRCPPAGNATRARRLRRLREAATVAAVVVVAVGVASLPQAADAPTPLPRMVATVDVPAGAPVKLPIGQKSAASDFAGGYRALEA
jgi:predicted anti-sigma-YlaC factor YlaD